MSKFLTTKELADRWKMAVGSLENWRQRGKGPKYMKMGGSRNADVRYALKDVVSFEKKLLTKPDGENNNFNSR